MAPEFATIGEVDAAVARECGQLLRQADHVVIDQAQWDDWKLVRAIATDVIAALITRTDQGCEVDMPACRGSVTYVCPGLETGRTALAVARACQQAGAVEVSLICGILPRDSASAVQPLFVEMHGLVHPLVHRSLRWHIGD